MLSAPLNSHDAHKAMNFIQGWLNQQLLLNDGETVDAYDVDVLRLMHRGEKPIARVEREKGDLKAFRVRVDNVDIEEFTRELSGKVEPAPEEIMTLSSQPSASLY